MKNYIFIIAIVLWALTSCKKDEEKNITQELFKITETKIDDISVEIYSETEKITTGYNALILKFSKDNQRVNVNLKNLVPMMNMGMHSHTTPSDDYFLENNEIIIPIVFIMPSGHGTYWYFDVNFEYEGKEYEGEVVFNVEHDTNLQTFMYENQMHFVSMVTPRNPFKARTGLNTFKFVVYKRENMMSFPAVDDLDVVITPWMPDMDHGSPNNENPVSKGKGHYEGKVNFTMTGYWTVKSEFSLGGNKIGEVTHSFIF